MNKLLLLLILVLLGCTTAKYEDKSDNLTRIFAFLFGGKQNITTKTYLSIKGQIKDDKGKVLSISLMNLNSKALNSGSSSIRQIEDSKNVRCVDYSVASLNIQCLMIIKTKEIPGIKSCFSVHPGDSNSNPLKFIAQFNYFPKDSDIKFYFNIKKLPEKAVNFLVSDCETRTLLSKSPIYDTTSGTTTDANGYYTIQAEIGVKSTISIQTPLKDLGFMEIDLRQVNTPEKVEELKNNSAYSIPITTSSTIQNQTLSFEIIEIKSNPIISSNSSSNYSESSVGQSSNTTDSSSSTFSPEALLSIQTPPDQKASGLSFSDIDGTTGEIGGKIAITKASDESNIESYVLYYGDSSNSKTLQIAEFAKTGSDFLYNIPLNTSASLGSYLLVYTKNSVGEMAEGISLAITDKTDITPPLPGNLGNLTGTNYTPSSITVNWTSATDDFSLAGDIQYLAYYSTANNIATVANMEANGTAIGTYSPNISSVTVSGLSQLTMYYFNVIAKDEYGNKMAFSMQAFTTPDGSAPVVGNSGTITSSAITSNSLSVNWTAATDNNTPQANLEYKVLQSSTANISSIFTAEINGTLVQDWTTNINTKSVTGLSEATTYYFNILTRDAAGNKSIYNIFSAVTADVTAPVAGNSGTLTGTGITASSMTINWNLATDNFTTQSSIQYLAYYSTANNIDTVANIQANGIAIGSYTPNITSSNATGLSQATTYYLNVIAMDLAGNKTSYTSQSFVTSDISAPTPGNGGSITTSSVTTNSLNLNWTYGTDNLTPQASLQYKVVQSASNNINTVANANANGTVLQDWTVNINTKSATGLSEGTTYYFTVLIRDASLNEAVYTTLQLTHDATTPVPGGGGTLTTGSVSYTTLTLSWTAATDNVTVQGNLQYKIVYSFSNNISTVLTAESNGGILMNWSTNTTNFNASSLSMNTMYYFAVLVRDAALNESIYSVASATTLNDTTAPSPGGTITVTNATTNYVTISWPAASDNATSAGSLQYKIANTNSNTPSTVNSAPAYTWVTGSTSTNVGGSCGSSVNINILVMDSAGNYSVYTAITASILSCTPAYKYIASTAGQSCVQVCSTHGGIDFSSINYLAMDASGANCQTAAASFAKSGTLTQWGGNYPCIYDDGSLSGGARIIYSTGGVSSGNGDSWGDAGGYFPICACNN